MKPIRLVVKAFGPYIEEQTLDFSLLGGRQLFLLTGPTGSGKTMLLDAICYALFGECSGESRGARSIRSDHAAAGQPTSVEFDFALGAEEYRVRRSPEQERPKRRGTGTIKEPAQATLWRKIGEDPEGERLGTQPHEVNEQIQKILGFTSAQFRQVVVLPQGEFNRFLDAKSGEREQILEVLFQTGEYRRIEEALSARAAAVAGEWQARRKERDLILSQAGAASREELASAIERGETEEKAKQAEREELHAQAEAARAALEEARDDDRRLKELREAQAAYDAVEAGRPANEARKEELDRARRAGRVQPLEGEAAGRRRDSEHAAGELEIARKELSAAEEADKSARLAFEAEERRQPERDAAEREVRRLEVLRGKVRDLDAARADLAAAQRAADAAAEDAKKAQRALDDCARAIEAKRAEQEKAAREAEPLARLTIESERLTVLLQTRKALEGDNRKLAAARAVEGEARARRVEAEAALAKARENCADAERRWIEGQAAVLASKLVEGRPCPVCGSAVHPAPADGREAAPSGAVLKRARSEVDRLQQERDEAAAAEHAKSVEAAKAQAAVEEKRQALGDAAEVPVRELARRLDATQRDLAAAHAAASKAAQIRTDLEELAARERDLRAQRDKAEAEARTAAGAAAARSQVFKQREAEVPEDLRAQGALEKAIERARAVAAALERALEQARDRAAQSAQRLAGAVKTEQAKRETAERAARAALEARTAFDAARSEAGFKSADEYRAAVRREDQIAEIERLIAKFESELAAAESRLRRARDQAEGVRQPDLAALEAAYKQANERFEACVHQIADLKSKIEAARKLLEALNAAAAESERLEKRYHTVALIAEAAKGNNPLRVSFQRFVQATLLDRVLEAATVRLRLMSRGRYELQRAAGTLDRRSAAGLDLEVFDAHTGAARPVSTLSGGEGFQASLALALGLAGVVQSHAGGLRLESIFIDEGFGSLDAEALALAMDTLRDLQQGGRLIGVVSHVAELKEQIPARLEVKPGRRGSEARFVLN